MKKSKFLVRTGIILAACVSLAAGLAAFEWPQKETSASSFFSYFGQLRGGTLESSLIFNDTATVHAADSGTIALIITEHGDGFGWFESTLGNAVIISHDDQMQTVYANLDEDELSESLFSVDEVHAGQELGVSGNSGWQAGESCLEFQVVDVKSGNVINPRELMPRIGTEPPLEMGRVSADNEVGKTYYLNSEKSLPSGTYRLYHTRQKIAVPKRTAVALNGATVETIMYDSLHEVDGRLCASGNRNYPVEELYPDEDRQLLGTVQLMAGRANLRLVIVDSLGTAQASNYNIEVY